MRDEGMPVSIFWAVPVRSGTQTVTKVNSLADAEPYGDKLTRPNEHHEAWSAWQRHDLPAAIAWHDYKDLSRGQVVFSIPISALTVCTDLKLLGSVMQTRIVAAFRLPIAITEWRTDTHYRTPPRSLP